jgi:ferredoxin-NADP reductase
VDNRNQYVSTVVDAVHQESARIRRYCLKCADDWELPPFAPGAHIDVILASGASRQYSLCGDPRANRQYQIAVLRADEGRGGSIELHHELHVGSSVSVSLPRNLFPLAAQASNHVFIAGGNGITPYIAMIAELERRSARYELHYCARHEGDFAFRDFLCARERKGRIKHYCGSERLDIAKLLERQHAGQHVYCCGPVRMLESFDAAAADWPQHRVHKESFAVTPPTGPSYEVILRRSQRVLEVVAGKSLLHTLKDAGLPMKVGCEAGICTLCKVPWIAGSPVHRDHVLTEEERRSFLLSCVCGSEGNVIELDL